MHLEAGGASGVGGGVVRGGLLGMWTGWWGMVGGVDTKKTGLIHPVVELPPV